MQAAAFVKDNLWDGATARLLRSFCKGPSSVAAFADDYAYLIAGLLDLHGVTGDVQWLAWSLQLQQVMDELFWDGDAGALHNLCSASKSVDPHFQVQYNRICFILRLLEKAPINKYMYDQIYKAITTWRFLVSLLRPHYAYLYSCTPCSRLCICLIKYKVLLRSHGGFVLATMWGRTANFYIHDLYFCTNREACQHGKEQHLPD